MQTARAVGGRLIDITNYSMSWQFLFDIAIHYHQGRDTFRNHTFEKQSEEDKEFNKQFLRKGVVTLHDAKFSVNSNGEFVKKAK